VLTSQYQKGVLTVDFQAMIELKACSKCHGAKLRPESLHVYLVNEEIAGVNGELLYEHELKRKYNIFDLQSLPLIEVVAALAVYQQKTDAPTRLVERINTPLMERAQTIDDLGLGYMSTSRKINTLS
jgi:excinuclease UvrABC ATPase subunit